MGFVLLDVSESLCLLWDSEYHIHECEDDGEYEGDPESTDLKSWNQSCHEKYHENIDDEWDETESQDIEREGEDFEKWSDSTIYNSEDNRDDDSRHISIDLCSRSEVSGYSYSYTWYEDVQQNTHKIKG